MTQNKHSDKYSDLSHLPEEYLELDQTLKAAFSILEIASKNRHTLFTHQLYQPSMEIECLLEQWF